MFRSPPPDDPYSASLCRDASPARLASPSFSTDRRRWFRRTDQRAFHRHSPCKSTTSGAVHHSAFIGPDCQTVRPEAVPGRITSGLFGARARLSDPSSPLPLSAGRGRPQRLGHTARCPHGSNAATSGWCAALPLLVRSVRELGAGRDARLWRAAHAWRCREAVPCEPGRTLHRDSGDRRPPLSYSAGAKSSKNGEKVPSRPSASSASVISQTARRLTSRRRSTA